MRIKNSKLIPALLMILIFAFSHTLGVCADENWVTRAHLTVPETGIVESILPPDLHFMPGTEGGRDIKWQTMDLELIGPDLNPRSFELFWKEESDKVSFDLEAVKIELGDDLGLSWEGSIPQRIRADHMKVIISDRKGMGKVNVHALVNGEWRVLAKNAAIYKTGKNAQANIHIKPGEYQRFRLLFHGYDKKWINTPLPIEKIQVSGKKPGRGYAYEYFSPEFKQVDRKEAIEIQAKLPGSGIWVDEIKIATQAQFQGTWAMGKEAIISGKKQYQEIMKGSLFWVKESQGLLTINVKRKWPGHSMIIRLDPQDRFVGDIRSFDIKARLPRLVFLADQPGTYTARTGLDKPAKIRNISGDQKRRIQHTLVFTSAEKNKGWRPVDYVEKYATMGGPFDRDGYTWKASIDVATQGVFRMVLNRQACSEPNQLGLRLVRGETQIPFFDGVRESQKMDLFVDPDYDKKNNRTTWSLKLPTDNINWSAIQIEANGIFNRQVVIETHKYGGMKWERWKTIKWVNRKKKEAKLRINMTYFPKNQNELRISVDHGDNQPLALTRIQAWYPARTFIFLAQEAGEYEIVGGHPKAAAPVYDLSLVQDILLRVEPKKTEMGKVVIFKGPGFSTRFTRVFSDRGWGLYIVLGLVTVVLLAVIVILFPKEE